jgi:hypothetical protein
MSKCTHNPTILFIHQLGQSKTDVTAGKKIVPKGRFYGLFLKKFNQLCLPMPEPLAGATNCVEIFYLKFPG